MLTPSDKVNMIAKAIGRLVDSEGVEPSFIEEMSRLLESAKEEEIIYQTEETDYWEQCKEDYIQRQVDKRRGK